MWWMQALTPHADYFRNEDTWSVKEGYADVNYDAYYPRPVVSGGGKNRQTQTRYLQDASYIRLKNRQVGYTLRTGDYRLRQGRFGISPVAHLFIRHQPHPLNIKIQ